MTSNLLLPNKFKIIGWFILIPTIIAGAFLTFTGFDSITLNAKVFALLNTEFMSETTYFQFIKTDITQTLVGVLFLIGGLLVSFSKEKIEDEYIAKLRLSSLLWAVGVNYILLLLCFVFVYGTGFLTVMVYNMFTVLIIFIIRFNYLLLKNAKMASYEK